MSLAERGKTERKGDWIQTFSGLQFWPLDPRPEEINIEDIAHALAMQCRYSGHVETFYSVADHSIRVAEIVTEPLKLAALLHDAAEAYLVDLPRPIKRFSELGRHYREIEDALCIVICERFGLAPEAFDDPSIKHCDNVLLSTEKRDLMKIPPKAWFETEPPLETKIVPLTWRESEKKFLETFNTLAVAR